jgi:hypothetical protein
MIEQSRREGYAAESKALLFLRAAKTANDGFANGCRFNGVIGFGHARSQVRQLLTTELTLSVQLIRKTDHAKLFLGIKTFDLLDDLLRCHTSMI